MTSADVLRAGSTVGRLIRHVVFGALAALTLQVTSVPASADVAIKRVSADPFTEAPGQHATEVEPDTFAFGSTVVAAFQVGRVFDGGSSNIGYVRSLDGGATWSKSKYLPGITANTGWPSDRRIPYFRVTDPSVAYDAKHDTWMITSVPLTQTRAAPTVLVSRSTNGGDYFLRPVSITAPSSSVSFDKTWTVCDNHSGSPHYGSCYTTFDDSANGELVYMTTSTDGGRSWSGLVSPSDESGGVGGQPVVQPDGTVIVPFDAALGTISSFSSVDGGVTWSVATAVTNIKFHPNAGGLRTSPLPSAEVDGDGTVYVAWEDCRFEPLCAANDIVFSSSSDGVNWSRVRRIPLDAVDSGVDHFIPGLAVDARTSGAGAHLAVTYYDYPDAACTADTCQLEVRFASSPDGGASWSTATRLAGPMALSDLAPTSDGQMVGDYISTSFNDAGTATTVFAIGQPHAGPTFDEGMWAPVAPLPVSTPAAATRRTSSSEAATGAGAAAPLLLPRKQN